MIAPLLSSKVRSPSARKPSLEKLGHASLESCRGQVPWRVAEVRFPMYLRQPGISHTCPSTCPYSFIGFMTGWGGVRESVSVFPPYGKGCYLHTVCLEKAPKERGHWIGYLCILHLLSGAQLSSLGLEEGCYQTLQRISSSFFPPAYHLSSDLSALWEWSTEGPGVGERHWINPGARLWPAIMLELRFPLPPTPSLLVWACLF